MTLDPQARPGAADAAPLLGLAPLMRQHLSGVDLGPLGATLLARARANPGDGSALLDLSVVLQLTGKRDVALAVQAEALQLERHYRVPATGAARLRLLVLCGPGDLMANTPIEFLLEGSDVALEILYVAPGQPLPAAPPDHDLVFVAVAESEENQPLLQQLEGALGGWPRPVLNAPGRVARLSRDGAWALLRSTPGVVMPRSVRTDRGALERVGRGEVPIGAVLPDGAFPIIVRPVGSHAGHGLARLDDPAALAAHLRTVAAPALYASRFVDYRSADGLFRKYRVALVAGRPFACHMAISERWMIHYLNAGMTESTAKRAEEARFMERFDDDFAPRHRDALRAIQDRVGLDYVGLDCGETPAGELLIFEVDSSMVVHAIDPVELFPYKQPQMAKVFRAFRELLASTARREGGP